MILRPIFLAQGKLTWTHYRALIPLPTVEAQRLYEDAGIENGWSGVGAGSADEGLRGAGAFGGAVCGGDDKVGQVRPL